MSQDDDPVNPNNNFNLLSFVQTQAESVKNGTTITPKKANNTFTPMMFSRPKSPSTSDNMKVNDQEINIDDEDTTPPRPSIGSMRFNPISSTSSQPINFTKQTPSDQHIKTKSPPFAPSMPSQTPKLSYSELEVLNRSATPSNKLPSNAKYGIGAALLKKMGYIEGKGLGKNNQGIIEPIKHDARQAGRGLDVSRKNKEKKGTDRLTTEDISEEESSDEEEEEGIIRFNVGKQEDLTPSLYQFIVDLESLGIQVPSEIKLLSNESTASVTSSRLNFIELNKEGTSDKIQKVKTELINLKDALTDVISLKKQSELKVLELQYLDDHLREKIDSKKSIVQLLDKLEQICQGTSVGKEESIHSIQTFLAKFEKFKPTSSLDIDIEKLLIIAIRPFITDIFSIWDPLDITTTDSLDKIITWKNSLPSWVLAPASENDNTLNSFQSLLYSLWFPMTSTALRDWPVDQPNLPITLILDWGDVLDESIINNLMNTVMLKNIVTAVKEWKFNNCSRKHDDGNAQETTPPYVWIFEWLPFIGNGVEEVKNEFIIKYGSFLDSWNGVDVIEGLDSFKEIVGELTYNLFLEKKVIPKLCYFLTNPSFYRFNSSTFDNTLWLSLLSFEHHLPKLTFEKLLKLGFLANWLRSLQEVLAEVRDFYKVSKVLKSWYFQFKPYFTKYPMVEERYTEAMEMINKFMNGYRLESTVKLLTQHELLSITLNKQKQLQEKPRVQRVEVTFKDAVEDYCYEKGWLFEVANGAHNDLSTGKKLFQIKSNKRKLTVSLESDVLFVKTGNEFQPISVFSLDSMLP
ncbi:hypothetical protein WICPIJ_009742 [Wickerhamomyces pijperi]|uniref:G-patch domain-containing protein n=1 Tax=Wickerhamomyces pijperi TaxID=599730 RepID=A0A9P8PJK7_WICPI|nr:hypothetical protein WICPIJ_009742 [Wickerhamomyces pijperi]